MVKIISENIISNFENTKSDFDGTIIDIETIGQFRGGYDDSRQYKEIIPVIFGFINREGLNIYCAKNKESIPELKEEINTVLSILKRPFYAFNSNFEEGVLFHYLRNHIRFDRELNKEKFEPKWAAVQSLNIQNYGDPFKDNGKECMESWLKRNIEKSIAHNRSCLLKERDILLKRRFRKPDELKLII